jgi:di/tricarboxylate transporter
VKFVPLSISLFLFVVLLVVRITPKGSMPQTHLLIAEVDCGELNFNSWFFAGEEVQQRCLAMLVFVTTLWVTEALPYFATALLVPPLVVFLNILNDKQHPETLLTSSMFSDQCFTGCSNVC